MREHEKLDSAEQAVLENLQHAILSEKFMASIWKANPDGTLTMYRTTFQFPHGGFDTAIQMLKKDLDDEVNPPKPEPLPRAEEFGSVEITPLSKEDKAQILEVIKESMSVPNGDQ
jgi:hypothetical protein